MFKGNHQESLGKENQLEVLLDSPASPSLVRRLVWAGVVPSKQFIRALVLSKDNSLFKRYGMFFLYAFSFLYIFSALIVFSYAKWTLIPDTLKIIFGFVVLFTSCIYAWKLGLDTQKGKLLLFISSLSVGFLLFFSASVYSFNLDAWVLFSLWSLFILPWVILAKGILLSVLWFFILNCSLFYWGWQNALPSSYLRWSEFLGVLAITNGCFLALRESLVLKLNQKWLNKKITRLLPLLLSLFYASVPVLGHIFWIRGNDIISSFMIFVLVFVLSFLFFYKIAKDLYALTIIILSLCIIFCFWWLKMFIFSSSFGLLQSLVAFVFLGFFSWLLVKVKDNKKGGRGKC